MILCWATLIAVLGRMRLAGHSLDSPDLSRRIKKIKNITYYQVFTNKRQKCFLVRLYIIFLGTSLSSGVRKRIKNQVAFLRNLTSATIRNLNYYIYLLVIMKVI